VLAFPAWGAGTHIPPGAPLLLGELRLAFEPVVCEACEAGQAGLASIFVTLVVHGVLPSSRLRSPERKARAAGENGVLETSILAELGSGSRYGDTMSLIEPEL